MTKWQVEKNLKVSSSLKKRNINEDDDNNDVYWDMSEYYESDDYYDWEGRIDNLINQPWEWYMEIDRKKQDGWTLVKVNQWIKEETVLHWLSDMEIEFEYSHPAYLIQDPMHVTMMTLRFT